MTSCITLTQTNRNRGVQDSISLFGHTINTIELQNTFSQVCHGNVECCNTIKLFFRAYLGVHTELIEIRLSWSFQKIRDSHWLSLTVERKPWQGLRTLKSIDRENAAFSGQTWRSKAVCWSLRQITNVSKNHYKLNQMWKNGFNFTIMKMRKARWLHG